MIMCRPTIKDKNSKTVTYIPVLLLQYLWVQTEI